jgi:thiamine phosphate synthase YjbQ (UPF0047 family)
MDTETIRIESRMRETITLQTTQREVLIDITSLVKDVVERSGIDTGLVNIYAQGATGAIMIQENWDGNGDAHLKSGLVGPSETIPLIEGQLGLSTWQNIFFCEFDGPRKERRIVCTVIADE